MLATGKRSRFNVTSLFLDVMTTLTVMFAAMLCVVIKVASVDVGKAQEEATALAVGNISVEVQWTEGANVDVDLWVQAPGDRQPVGYSRRSDAQSSYVRDDVGRQNDPGTLNFENTFVRGAAAGRYVVNLHLYQLNGEALPVRAQVRATLLPSKTMPSKILAIRPVELAEQGQEVTAFSFELDDQGNLVEGSESYEYTPLRKEPGNE